MPVWDAQPSRFMPHDRSCKTLSLPPVSPLATLPVTSLAASRSFVPRSTLDQQYDAASNSTDQAADFSLPITSDRSTVARLPIRYLTGPSRGEFTIVYGFSRCAALACEILAELDQNDGGRTQSASSISERFGTSNVSEVAVQTSRGSEIEGTGRGSIRLMTFLTMTKPLAAGAVHNLTSMEFS
jgi:hypothetical protein